jgi:hypothetical protein
MWERHVTKRARHVREERWNHPPNPRRNPVTPTAANALSLLVLDAIAGIVILLALRRIWSTPSWMWAHRHWSKVAWTVVVLWLNITASHVIWPVGAVLALRHARKLARNPLPEPPPLPYASGEDGTGWWNIEGAHPIRWSGEKPGTRTGVGSVGGSFDQHWHDNVTYEHDEDFEVTEDPDPAVDADDDTNPGPESTTNPPPLRLIIDADRVEDTK